MVTYFQNARWRVTDFGLESVALDDGNHCVERSGLLEIDNEGFCPLYVWPTRVCDQIGIDIEAFIEAWLKAIEIHSPLLLRVDRRILADSLREARVRVERKTQRLNQTTLVGDDLPAPVDAPSPPSAEAPSPPRMEAPTPARAEPAEIPATDAPKIR
jgi:hypothetical protein